MTGSNGAGGSVLAGQISLDGDLTAVKAVGGKISTNLIAQRIGTVGANRSDKPGDAGNIEGRLQGTSMDLVQSIGGVITATLFTSDRAHRNLRVESLADPRYSDSGRIVSRAAFTSPVVSRPFALMTLRYGWWPATAWNWWN